MAGKRSPLGLGFVAGFRGRRRVDINAGSLNGIADHGIVFDIDRKSVITDRGEENLDVVEFEIRLRARMAWAEPGEGDGFVTGWEFNRDTGEPRIG